MIQIKVHKIETDAVWELFLQSWNLARINYALSLMLAFMVLVAGALNNIPFVGVIIFAACQAVVPLLYLNAAAAWESGDSYSFEKFKDILKDKDLREKMMPLMLIQFGLVFIPGFLSQMPLVGVFFSASHLLMIPIQIITMMVYPIMLFNPGIKLEPAINLAIDAIAKNIAPFLVALCMIIALFMIGAVAFLVGLLFFSIPVFHCFSYIWYRVIFEGLGFKVGDKSII